MPVMKKLLILLFFISFNAYGITVKHDFDVSLGIFDACDTQFEYGMSQDKYHIQSNIKTQGTLDLLYPFVAEYQTVGNIKKDKLVTSSYKYKSKGRFSKRSKELIYDEDGNPLYRISSKNDKENRVEIKKDIKNQDTTDLQSVFAEMAKQYNTVKFCASRMEVFDGKRRFDVIFKDEGKEELVTPYFKGTAAKCSMYIDSLGSKGDDLLWELSSDKPVMFWILEDSQTKAPFIAKVLVSDTALGKLEVTTKKIEVKK